MKKPTKHLLSKRQLDYYLANATYLNHTWNLRSSLGYAVTYNGKEKRRFIGDQNHTDPTAGVEANKALNEVNKAGTGVIFVDGMDYASFVSSKGYDVIDTAEAYLKRELNKQQ